MGRLGLRKRIAAQIWSHIANIGTEVLLGNTICRPQITKQHHMTSVTVVFCICHQREYCTCSSNKTAKLQIQIIHENLTVVTIRLNRAAVLPYKAKKYFPINYKQLVKFKKLNFDLFYAFKIIYSKCKFRVSLLSIIGSFQNSKFLVLSMFKFDCN